MTLRTDWTLDEVRAIYHQPLLALVFEAGKVHHENDSWAEVQVSNLISVKTGGCKEDCSYCSQSARFETAAGVHPLMKTEAVMQRAIAAKEMGASRICLGASWREVRDNRDFDRVLEMVAGINELGLEVCCTLGMLSYEQAQKLKEAGCFAYNHNLDTSREHYGNIITTRTYDDRLETLANVRKAKMTVCCGGIVGLGETDEDRVKMLHTLATFDVHPESVPINALVAVEGTEMENMPRVSIDVMLRMIATARILMPKSLVRLSAGRNEMSMAEQALCFMAGANSVFAGEKLLTTPNPGFETDREMFRLLGLTPRVAFKEQAFATELEN